MEPGLSGILGNMRTTLRRTIPLVFVAILSTGCDGGYFLHLAFGQLGVLLTQVPVSQALNDPNLTDEERHRLAITQQVRQFGIDVMGLRDTDSYTVFHYNGMEPAAWVVSASARDSITPFLWDYPIIGRFSTRGFFDEDFARRVGIELFEMGYDVFLGRAAGFSTLNFFPDPVRQSNLQLDEIELAELILHEMLHQTIFKLGDGNFNESMATFVGRTGAQAWFDATYGPNSPEAQEARVRYADKLVIDAFVNLMYAHMNQYYNEAAARGEPSEMIIANREAEFESLRQRYLDDFEPQLQDPDFWEFLRMATFDNARLAAAIVYQGGLSDFQAVFDKVGGDFRAALAVFDAAANQSDSRAYLREFVQP